MRKLYETPEITVTKFDIKRNVMLEFATGNEGPGDGWNAGIDDLSNVEGSGDAELPW